MIDRFDSQDSGGGQAYQFDGGSLAKNIVIAVIVVLGAAGMYFWTYCRIQVGEEQFVPLLKKTGTNIANEMLLVGDPKMKDSDKLKGPRFQVLKAGRYFPQPLLLVVAQADERHLRPGYESWCACAQIRQAAAARRGAGHDR